MNRVAEIARFCIVGGLAALCHWSVAVSLVNMAAWAPQAANLTGFLTAFFVSYGGQRWFTFKSDQPHRAALPRHFVVSVAAFAINAVLLQLLLARTALPYPIALAIVLVLVAVLTFAASRLWTFRKPA